MNIKYSVFCLIGLILSWLMPVFAQSGGNFTITKSVIAGGGGRGLGGAFAVDATLGQPFAGTASTGGTFALTSGFWNGGSVPASNVTISGRVLTSSGQGLKNAVVTLMNTQGVSIRVITSSFGFYTFSNIATGNSYLVTVTSKRFRFSSKNLFVTDNVQNFDFVGIE